MHIPKQWLCETQCSLQGAGISRERIRIETCFGVRPQRLEPAQPAECERRRRFQHIAHVFSLDCIKARQLPFVQGNQNHLFLLCMTILITWAPLVRRRFMLRVPCRRITILYWCTSGIRERSRVGGLPSRRTVSGGRSPSEWSWNESWCIWKIIICY